MIINALLLKETFGNKSKIMCILGLKLLSMPGVAKAS